MSSSSRHIGQRTDYDRFDLTGPPDVQARRLTNLAVVGNNSAYETVQTIAPNNSAQHGFALQLILPSSALKVLIYRTL